MEKKKKRKKKICAGQGALANILTSMINPKVSAIPKGYQSLVIIMDQINQKGKYHYTLHFEGEDETELFHFSFKYVNFLKKMTLQSF